MIPVRTRVLAIFASIPGVQFQPYTLDLAKFIFPSIALRKVDKTELNLRAIVIDAPPSRMVSSTNCAWFLAFTPLAIFKPLSSPDSYKSCSFLLVASATKR